MFSKEALAKVFIGLLAIATIAFAFLRPNIDQEFHVSYSRNLLNLQTLSDRLALDILQSHMGYVLHHDYIEADLQQMEKSARLAMYSPRYVSPMFQNSRNTLVSNYLEILAEIAENTNQIKTYISLIRNTDKYSRATVRKIVESLSSGDPTQSQMVSRNQAMKGLIRYQHLLEDQASKSDVFALLTELKSIIPDHANTLESLLPHAGILSTYKPLLASLMHDTSETLGSLDIPDILTDQYNAEHTAAVKTTNIFLWLLSALGGTLVVTSVFLVSLSQSNQRRLQQKSREIEDNIQTSQAAVAVCTEVLGAISHGDFSQRVNTEFHGELNALKTSVNRTADRVESTMQELSRVMNDIEMGKFDIKLDDSVEGSFRTTVESMLTTFNNTFDEISSVMESMSRGEFNTRVEGKANGALERLKEAINESMASLEGSLLEISDVLVAQKEGNLIPRVTTAYPGQLLTLSDAVNISLDKTQSTFNEINEVTGQVYSSSTEISNGNLDLNKRTKQAMDRLDSASTSVLALHDGLIKISKFASDADQQANNTSLKAARGQEVIVDAVQAMEQINHSSRKIAQIISVIDSIAFQTNLLALNASVEAARAGEEGRGFSVVASEVRTLAGRSADAAKQIKELIEDSASKVQRGSLLVNQSGETLEEIVDGVNTMLTVVASISSTSTDQNSTIEQVRSALSGLASITQKNVELAEMVTSSSDQSTQRITRLKTTMEFFQTGTDDHLNQPEYQKAS